VTANPGHVAAVVLATDGFPTECNPEDVPSVAAIASSGAGATPSIQTFVIGVFAAAEQAQATTNLNQIALAGGSDKALVISTSSSVTQDFLAALAKIRTNALPCEFGLPVPPSGMPDYGAVNVVFESGGQSRLVPKVAGALACDPQLGGWYYDVEPAAGTPKKVELCGRSCSAVQADAAGAVDVVLGCATVIL
jgi:hypothetical protein